MIAKTDLLTDKFHYIRLSLRVGPKNLTGFFQKTSRSAILGPSFPIQADQIFQSSLVILYWTQNQGNLIQTLNLVKYSKLDQ